MSDAGTWLPNIHDSPNTVGGAELPAVASQTAPSDEPNGWFVGPADDPDRYALLGAGIAGGEGVTWRARYQGSLESPLPLAVKVQHPPDDPPDGWPSAQDRSRWRDQTTLMRHMRLDHVVRVNDMTAGPPPHRLGKADGSSTETMIIEMEWVEGQTLAAAIRSAPTTTRNVRQRAGWIADACTALSQLHSHTRTAGNPTVHRDVTPANCIVTPDRGLILIDVSTMQLPQDGVDPSGRHTPAYSAPEVLAMPHNPRTSSADVYAIGALAFFCLTGQDPPTPIPDYSTDRLKLQLGAAVDRLALDLRTLGHVLQLLAPESKNRPNDLLAWSRLFRKFATPRPVVLAARTLRHPLVAAPLALVIAGGAVGSGFLLTGHDAKRAHTRIAESVSTNNTLGKVFDARGGLAAHDFYSKQGRIIRPASGATVRDCEDFTGTAAKLPAGQTLVVSEHNLSDSGTFRFIEVTIHYDHPETIGAWHSPQFFNPAAVGQNLVIELIQVPLTNELVQAENQTDQTQSFQRKNQIALAQGKVLAAVTVTHVNQKNPSATCDVPPSLASD